MCRINIRIGKNSFGTSCREHQRLSEVNQRPSVSEEPVLWLTLRLKKALNLNQTVQKEAEVWKHAYLTSRFCRSVCWAVHPWGGWLCWNCFGGATCQNITDITWSDDDMVPQSADMWVFFFIYSQQTYLTDFKPVLDDICTGLCTPGTNDPTLTFRARCPLPKKCQ